ncbi:hypothetical protein RUND412_003994 [Rhizina undulata]
MKTFTIAVGILASLFTFVLAQSVSGVTAVDCHGYAISKSAVQSAAQVVLDHLNAVFTFKAGCKAPYYEFPVLKSFVYTGDAPRYDRVVIDSITHCGASGNGFLQCT